MGHDSKVTIKGQTTIPMEIRKMLDINPGDLVHYEIRDGEVIVRKKHSIMELAGILYDPNRMTVTLEEMDEAIGDAIVERYERSLDRD